MASKKDAAKLQQEEADQVQEQGYRGSVPDPTPNEHYTVAGVTAGKPTPETDEELAEEARQRQQALTKGEAVEPVDSSSESSSDDKKE